MLTEIDKSFLQRLTEEEGFIAALQKYFRMSVRKHIPDNHTNETNEVLGQKLRAYWEARGIIDKALESLGEYKGRKFTQHKIQSER